MTLTGVFTGPNMKEVPPMSDCFCKSDLRDFCDLMMLPDGTPIIPVDMLDWLASHVEGV